MVSQSVCAIFRVFLLLKKSYYKLAQLGPIYKNIAVHCNLKWVDSLSFRFNSINYFLFQVAKLPVKLLREIREP